MVNKQQLYTVIYKERLIVYSFRVLPYELVFHSEAFYTLTRDDRVLLIVGILEHHKLEEFTFETKFAELPLFSVTEDSK